MADTQNKQYTFRDAHRPNLSAGEYTLTSNWSVKFGETVQASCETKAEFFVAGERFSLAPADVQAVYPPEGSRGSFENDLPHVALARDTLPWERAANAQGAPWLALLLLNEAEAARHKLQTMTLGKYREKLPASFKFELEYGQDDSDQVQVIELSAGDMQALLPGATELSVLCHVRAGERNAELLDGVAIVVGKRLPSHGKNTVHLVSLENRYNSDGFDAAGQTNCALVVLKSWVFTCEEANHPEAESLDGLFERLNADWLRLRLPEGSAAQAYTSLGLMPLPHHFRSGESGASWYSGALVPGRGLPAASNGLKFPARSADELLWYHQEVGMLNVTYAAAWELGRLLVMQNRRVFASLHAWRHQQISHAYAAAAAAPNSRGCHLPQVQRACPCDSAEPPKELTAWIEGLYKLQGIPFRYLVADERMLPVESIRFFQVDPQWMNALLDGALSTVRTPTEQDDCCKGAEEDLLKTRLPSKLTGFLLRSVAVTGWPGLQVTASGASGQSLPLYQATQLSPAINLYLFEGEIATLSIQQPPDTLHLSVKENPSLWKDSSKNTLNPAALKAASASDLAAKLLHHQQKLQILVLWPRPV